MSTISQGGQGGALYLVDTPEVDLLGVRLGPDNKAQVPPIACPDCRVGSSSSCCVLLRIELVAAGNT